MRTSCMVESLTDLPSDAGELLQNCNGVSKFEMAQAALLHLVNLEPRDLCSEAIVEKCRATRDLRNCGRTVQHVLTSCGHASLCAECGQRCDVCPICRVSIRRGECTMRLRLYEECLEAGLILPRDDDVRERDGHLNTDIQRLWSFFDVALDNKLVSLVSHYVSDVCMDDSAVSSNAIISMLLDGTIVKDWCKRTFLVITRNLRDIYNLGSKQMQSKTSALQKFAAKLSGLARVLESLEGPTSDAMSSPVAELQQLTEGVQRVSQHLEVMCWCVQHQFLENLPSCHPTLNTWRTAVRERKLAAGDRAWPDHLRNTSKAVSANSATLFIEDAMLNIGYGRDYEDDLPRDNPELGFLQQGMGVSSVSFRKREASGVQSVIQGSSVVYPPESLRVAVNLLFLEAESDLFLAKKAIFLYYLFDRHWPHCDGGYGTIVDDYVCSFDIPRHVMQESLLFYLLDNNNDMALKEACRILPKIVSCKMHPKVARVLLERQRPDAALDVLRCSSQDSNLRLAGSVTEHVIPDVVDAVTAIRARLECGLLTEAYTYQRLHISRVKAQVTKDTLGKMKVRDEKGVSMPRDSSVEMECLVGEMCQLCMQRNIVDKMLELPWQVDEENIVQKCLLENAIRDPSSTAGNLMVVYYIMRCRNVEAYVVHRKLCSIEESFIGQCNDEVKSSCVRSIRTQRTLLVEKCIELLPEVQQNQLRSGMLDAKVSVSSLDRKQEIFSQHLEPEARIPAFLERAQALSPLFSFPSNGKSELSQLPSWTLPDTSVPVGWGDFRQPSILHGKPFKASSGGSTALPQLNQTMSAGVARRESGEEQMSPILGRKLIYNGDSDSTCYPKQNTASKSDEEMLNALDCQSDSTKNDIHEGRDTHVFVSRRLQSDSSGTNGIFGRVRSTVNGEPSLQNDCTRVNFSERVPNGNLLLFDKSESVTSASNRSPKLGMRETENGSQGNKELWGEDPLLGLLSSPEIFKPRSRRHWLHSSPNGKRKAYDQLDAHEPSPASPVTTADGFSGRLQDEILKGSSKELHHGESSSEIDIATLRSQRNTGIRWRAEDGDMESSPSHSLPASKIKLYNMGRTSGGSRSFRNHAL